MEYSDEIVRLGEYDDSISASIAKTKLDAFGVPCFLTHENLANLYPGQNILSFKVQLYVFRNDVDKAASILAEANMRLEASEILCPDCSSRKIEHVFPKDASLRLLFFGIFYPKEKVYHCLDCDKEF